MRSLKEELEKQGWKLQKIVRFKNLKRITIAKRDVKVSGNLRGKQDVYSIQEILSALTKERTKK